MDSGRPRSAPIDLSARQRAIVATALTILAAAVIAGAVVGSLWLVAWVLGRFSHVFLPLAVGAVAALVLRPYYAWLRERLRLPAQIALVLVFVSFLLPVGAFAWFFGSLVVEQLSGLATRLPEWGSRLAAEARERWPEIQRFFEENPWGRKLRELFAGQSGAMVSGLQSVGGTAFAAGAGLFRLFGALAGWAVLPVYFAFFLMAPPHRPEAFERQLPFLKGETRKDVVYLLNEFVNIIVTFFRGQLLVASLMGLLFAVGFTIIGLSYGFVLGLLLGLLNIIPYLGSVIGLAVGLPLAYFQPGGGLGLVIGVLVVFTLVQLIEGYVLTPRIMGRRTGLHPIVIIVAVFFWGSALDGILGMILAIPLTAFLVLCWRLAREKYMGQPVRS
jgi:predicted PurR-regulated permease PerM